MDDKNGKQEESGVIKAQKPGPREFGRLRKRGSAVREGMIDTLMWILGCLLYAIAMNVFNVPNQIAPGGVSGIATLLNHLFHTPIGVMVMAINVPIFLIAWKFLGWRFLLNSMIATVLLSVSIDVTALFYRRTRATACWPPCLAVCSPARAWRSFSSGAQPRAAWISSAACCAKNGRISRWEGSSCSATWWWSSWHGWFTAIWKARFMP